MGFTVVVLSVVKVPNMKQPCGWETVATGDARVSITSLTATPSGRLAVDLDSRSNSSHFQPDTKQTSPLHPPLVKSGVVNLLCWECFESSTTATLQIAQNDYACVNSLACAVPSCLIQIFFSLLCYRFEHAYFR